MTLDQFKALSDVQKKELLSSLSDEQYLLLKYDWNFWARPNQLQPKELGHDGKFIWFIQAGRGFGKTKCGSEWVVNKVKNEGYKHIALVGAAADEVRTIMIQGESGILACSSPDFYPDYIPSKKQIFWPNGAIANIFYGTEPEKSRGAQSDLVWADEVAKWKYPEVTMDNLLMGLRLGKNPLCFISSTPKPTKFIKDLTKRRECIVVKGSTYDNIDNLAKPFIQTIITKYKGTRLGRQEIEAEILDDNPRALWKREWIDRDRISERPDCFRIVVAIDPPGTEPDKENPEKEVTECGIVVAGIGKALPGMQWPKENHFYIFDDLSLQASPTGWAKEAIAAYNKYRADGIVVETNFGGVMCKATLRSVDQKVPIYEVHASRGKYVRAEPVASLAEQGRIHHIGNFPELEDELSEWEPGKKSPNRLDSCFISGTKIITKQGNKNIEDLKINDFVLTSCGFNRILNTSKNYNEDILHLTLSNDTEINCTYDHPIFVFKRGYIPAWKLRLKDQLIVMNTKVLNLTGLNIEGISIVQAKQLGGIFFLTLMAIVPRAGLCCIEQFGNFIMEKYLKTLLFITKTKMFSIMTLLIWSAYQRKSMEKGIKKNLKKREESMQKISARLRLYGMGAKTAFYGIKNTVRIAGKKEKKMSSVNVQNAGLNLHLSLIKRIARDFVQDNAIINIMKGIKLTTKIMFVLFVELYLNKDPVLIENRKHALVSVVGLKEEKTKQTVYNLEVEKTHDYFANGILVHNCVWAITYLAGDIVYAPAPNVQKHSAAQFRSVVQNLPR